MRITEKAGGILVTDCDIDLYKTFDCGQCFRFDTVDGKTFRGVALGQTLGYKCGRGRFFR